MINFKLFLSSISLFALISLCGSSSPALDYSSILSDNSTQCINSIHQIDSLIKRVILMDGNKVLPVTEKLRDEFCTPLRQLAAQTKVYMKCAPKFIGTMAKVLVNSLKKPIKAICKTPLERNIKHFQCIDDDYIEKLLTIESKFVDSLEALKSPNLTRDFFVPGICCTMHKMQDSVKNIQHNPCSDSSANPNMFIHDRVAESIRDVVDLVCGPYPNFKVCQDRYSNVLEYLARHEKGLRDLKDEPVIANMLQIVANLAQLEDTS